MEAVMKIKFYQKLNALIKSKKDNNSFLSVEKYELLIQQINTLKHGNRKKGPKDYQLLKQYDVVQIGNVEQLIYPVAGSTSIKYYEEETEWLRKRVQSTKTSQQNV